MKKLLRIFYPLKRNKEVNQLIYFVLDEECTGTINNYGISDIKSRCMFDTVEVEITTFRPGIVIGKRGATIDRIKSALKEELKTKTVKITLKENYLWHWNKY